MAKRFGTWGRAVAVTVTTGVALSLAGCGNEAAPGDGAAGKDTSVKVDQASALSKNEIMTAAYDASIKAGSAHMSMTMTMNGQKATDMQGDVSYAGGKSSMKMTMTMPQMGEREMEMRYVDNIMYVQMPGLVPAGKFLAVDPKDKNSPLAKSFAGLTDQMDPMASVKSMQSAVISAERVGQESTQGVETDHYEVVVDMAKAVSKLGAVPKEAQAQLPKTITYDMWLDAENLVRKMTFDIVGTVAEIEMSDWGKPVTVQRPDAADIAKAPAMPPA